MTALDDRVTGAASRIGAGIATVLARAGAGVVVADRDVEGGERHAEESRQAGFGSGFVPVQPTEESSAISACAEIRTRYGTPWLHTPDPRAFCSP